MSEGASFCVCGHESGWHTGLRGTFNGCSIGGCPCQALTMPAGPVDPRDALLERAVVALESIAASLAKGRG